MNYTYNYPSANNGRLQSMVDNLDATKTQTFTYDSLNRLSQSTVGTTTTFTFAYDAYGNRTGQTATGPGPTMNLTYDTNNHITTTGYGYDPSGNGNLTAAPGSTVYNYDKENRLLSVTVASTTQGQYAYDGFGRRISKITPADNKQTFYFHTQVGMLGEYQRTAGTTQTPTLIKEYVYRGRTAVATVKNSGLTWEYYHADRLGSTRKVTNSSGTVTETHDYYPFGEEIAHTSDNQSKYTGYYRDNEDNAIDYALNRYYNSNIGRFLTVDPFRGAKGKPQSLNRYAYVINDPINQIDPNGLTCLFGYEYNELSGYFPVLLGCLDDPAPMPQQQIFVEDLPTVGPSPIRLAWNKIWELIKGETETRRSQLRAYIDNMGPGCKKFFEGQGYTSDFLKDFASTLNFYDTRDFQIANLAPGSLPGWGDDPNEPTLDSGLGADAYTRGTGGNGPAAPHVVLLGGFYSSSPARQGYILFHEMLHVLFNENHIATAIRFGFQGDLTENAAGERAASDWIDAFIQNDCRNP